MTALLLYANKNQKDKDATGAFIPQATLCERFHQARMTSVQSVGFDPLKRSRRQDFYNAINSAAPFDYLAYFGHGLRTGLPSAGIGRSDIKSFAQLIALRRAKNRPLIITLYACSAAGAPGKDRDRLDGDGGFADLLRDELSQVHGVKGWIDAHTVPGHATTNRMTRRFYMNGESVGTGGAWLVAPGSPEWAAWSRRMRAKGDEMRFLFPLLGQTELLLELQR